MNHHASRTGPYGPMLPLLLAVVAGIISASTAVAQSGSGFAGDTAVTNPPPMVRWYNWDDTTFYVGAYIPARDSLGRIAQTWEFMDAMGIHAHEHWGHPIGELGDQQYDTLASLADLANHPRRRYYNYEPRGGMGREVQFYPFDSTQSPYYLMGFQRLPHGDIRSAQCPTATTAERIDPK